MQKIAINFTQQQLAALNNALIEMPCKDAAPLIAHINAEIQRNFDQARDEDDKPIGATSAPDQFKGD